MCEVVPPARNRAGTGSGIRGPYSHVLPSASRCVITWSADCIAAGRGEQRPHGTMCATGLIYGGEGDVRKGVVFRTLLLGDFELPQSDAGKLAEEQFG